MFINLTMYTFDFMCLYFSSPPPTPHGSFKIQQFIARKADLLFKKLDKTLSETPAVVEKPPKQPLKNDGEEEESPTITHSDYYAILPPLEQYMVVPPDESRKRLFQLLHVGDVVTGRIVSIKEFGLFVQLIALCDDRARYVEKSEVIALIPAGELSDRFSKAVKVITL